MKLSRTLILFFCATLLFLALGSTAQAIPVDLTTFTADPGSAVSIAADGSTATMVEDPSYSSVLFYNDSVSIPAGATTLRFRYDFVLGADNADELNAYLYDSDFNHLTDEWITSTNGGTIAWNVSAYAGSTIGLEFDLNSLPGDSGFDSQATISNVRIDTAAAPVPEPCTLGLLGMGLAGLWSLRGTKRFF